MGQLKRYFLGLEKKYDSGLFDCIEGLEYPLETETLVDILKDLYFPYSPYDFNVIDTYLISQIYELFLVERLHNNDGSIEVVRRDDIVEARGIATTPKYIVRSILSELLPERIKEAGLDALQLKIGDICCGSGIFLIVAFETMVNLRRDDLVSKDKNAALKKGLVVDTDGTGNYALSFEERRRILENCIYGVDVDELAVEVTKLNLMLELLSGTNSDEIETYCKIHYCKILPNLDDNIKVGNSLIDRRYRSFDPRIDTDVSLMRRIKMFDWEEEFKFKFDCLVGNPPYVRVQKMAKHLEPEYGYYVSDKSGFTTATGTFDEYYLFIERMLGLINENGRIGAIVSNRFMTIKDGRQLRGFLSEQKCVEKIVDFNTIPVFEGKSNYTCLLFLKKKTEYVSHCAVRDLESFIEGRIRFTRTQSGDLGRDPWSFTGNDSKFIFKKMGDKVSKLGDITKIAVGLQTSADDVYLIFPQNQDGIKVKFLCEGETVTIERGILRPCIRDLPLKRYQKIVANCYAVFPYKENNGKTELIDEKTMADEYPMAWAYLNRFKDRLSKRSLQGKNKAWYQFGRNQGFPLLRQEQKLVWAVESLSANYVFDGDKIMFTGGGNGPYYGLSMNESTQESIFYIQALLNSHLLEKMVESIAPKIRGGYYSHGKEYVEALPIYRIDFSNPDEKAVHDEIVRKVQSMMGLYDQYGIEVMPSAREQIRKAIANISSDLDEKIAELYRTKGEADEKSS